MSDEQKFKQKVIQDFFIKKSIDPRDSASAYLTKDNEADSMSKLRASEQKSTTSCQHTEHAWSVKDSATKAEIIATLQFAFQNVPFSCAENLAVTNNSSHIHLLQRIFLMGLQRCHT